MEIIKRNKTVEVVIYKTSDGEEFTTPKAAQLHEDKIKGKKKDCPNCKGTGSINERYEKEWNNTTWVPTEGEYVVVRKSDICPDCSGKGYLELKWS